MRLRPQALSVNQTRAKQGAKEIVLLGQNVSSYKYIDDNDRTWTLVELIEEIAKIPEIIRIRYITSHPIDITQELINLHQKSNTKGLFYRINI